MYLILAYDVSVRRTNKVLKIARRYLYWVQNSVLEGDISVANYKRLKMELDVVIDPKEDSVVFYMMENMTYNLRETMGVQKRGDVIII